MAWKNKNIWQVILSWPIYIKATFVALLLLWVGLFCALRMGWL
ncbi:hypothetical protein [Comamonas koreensis]|jgi:hypothetical protein|nr:hypothetical protein [Comamonas koreensis]